MLRELLIKISLEIIETQGVPVLELPVIVSVLLEAVIGKMHIVILIIHVIPEGRSPQVPLPVHKNIDISSNNDPDADVEFPPVVKQRPFDVFLSNPVGG